MTIEQIQNLKDLLDKATPGDWEIRETLEGGFVIINKYHGRTAIAEMSALKLICALRNNAEDILRLAELGKKYEDSEGMIPFKLSLGKRTEDRG